MIVEQILVICLVLLCLKLIEGLPLIRQYPVSNLNARQFN